MKLKITLLSVVASALLLSGCNNDMENQNSEKPKAEITVKEKGMPLKAIEDKKIQKSIVKGVNSQNNHDALVLHADAGADQVALVNKRFLLDGNKSSGDIIEYEWSYSGHHISYGKQLYVSASRIGKYDIKLTLTDSNGESASDIVTVTVKDKLTTVDTTAPIIALKGDSPMLLTTGDTFTDPGATAIDGVDGKVHVSMRGEVDISEAGEYIRYYTATDKAGNKATLSRKVIVKDATSTQTPEVDTSTQIFVHPGLSSSAKELDNMRAQVEAGDIKEVMASYKTLTKHTRRLDREVRAHEILNMPSKHRVDWDGDGIQAYEYALMWAITKDKKYADAGIKILNTWAKVHKSTIGGVLHGTHQMWRWLNAAEILKYYQIEGVGSGWSDEDIKQFDTYVRKQLVHLSTDWEGNGHSAYRTQNQADNVALARMMLGIYLEEKKLFQSGYDRMFDPDYNYTRRGKPFFYPGEFRGKANHPGWPNGTPSAVELGGNPRLSLFEITIGENGEWMEMNRDCGHFGMTVSSILKLAQVLRHQGINLYEMKFNGEDTPRLLKATRWMYKGKFEGQYITHSGGQNASGKKEDYKDGPAACLAKRDKWKSNDENENLYHYYHDIVKGTYETPNLDKYTKEARSKRIYGLGGLLFAPMIGEESTADTTADTTNNTETSETAPVLDEETQAAYLEAINEARAVEQDCGSKGKKPAVDPVTWNDALYQASYMHTNDLIATKTFSHTGSGQVTDITAQKLHPGKGSSVSERIKHSGYDMRGYGENIAAGTDTDTAQKVVKMWLTSPGHCSNLMNPNFQEVGMAHIHDEGSRYKNYWTQDFGIN